MAETLYGGARRWLAQTSIVKNYRKIQSIRKLPKFSATKTAMSEQYQKSIVFLCPSVSEPQGGIKVIYNQAALINEMRGQLGASILHPYNPEFRCEWFARGAPVKENLVFDRSHDFVMIPECWAVPHACLLRELGVRYGIYVQGGYIFSRDSGYILNRDSGIELDDAYHNAALILAISEDTVECLNMAFPECAGKVYRVHCSVDSAKFVASHNKENIISYMPRKLKKHSELVTFYLNKMIPAHWRIEQIDGLNEDGVAAILGKSKIFLSFSELEGFSLPPVEAALSGCYVIGYTGEGAKEYWDNELFTEVYSGDIKAFVNAVLNKIKEIDSAPFVTHSGAIKNLADKYSSKVELSDMKFVANKIIEILDVVE